MLRAFRTLLRHRMDDHLRRFAKNESQIRRVSSLVMVARVDL